MRGRELSCVYYINYHTMLPTNAQRYTFIIGRQFQSFFQYKIVIQLRGDEIRIFVDTYIMLIIT